MEITHFGHACLLVVTAQGDRLLFDPGTLSSGFEALTGLAAILVTHQHDDHADVERIGALLIANPDARLVVNESAADALKAHSPLVVAPGDNVQLGASTVDVLGGTHEPIVDQYPGTGNNGYLLDGGAFYHPGDAFALPTVPVDILALAISGPWLKFADAVRFMRELRPRRAIPVHEKALASSEQAHTMLAKFAPEGTEFVVLPEGMPTSL